MTDLQGHNILMAQPQGFSHATFEKEYKKKGSETVISPCRVAANVSLGEKGA